ncbi:aminotransferase [Xanthomonas phaseoli]|nr:aminotransferase [Xanthomonas phaseoli]
MAVLAVRFSEGTQERHGAAYAVLQFGSNDTVAGLIVTT